MFYDSASIYLFQYDVTFPELFFVHDTVDLRSAQSFSSELSAIPYSVFAYFIFL